MSLGDRELLQAFQCARPDAVPRFGHREHLRVAWLTLGERELIPALASFCTELRRFAAAAGAPDKYHETLSVGFLLLVHERMAATGAAADSEAFLAAHPDLLEWPQGPLSELYTPGMLQSEAARAGFVLPDRVASKATVVPDRSAQTA